MLPATLQVIVVTASPSKELLASGSIDKTVRLWSLADGDATCAAVLRDHTSYVYTLWFSSDGATLASAGEDGCIKFWSVATHTLTKSVGAAHGGEPVRALLGGASGEMFSGGFDGSIKCWDLGSHCLVHNVKKAHSSRIFALCSSPLDGFMASASANATVNVWRHTPAPPSTSTSSPSSDAEGAASAGEGTAVKSSSGSSSSSSTAAGKAPVYLSIALFAGSKCSRVVAGGNEAASMVGPGDGAGTSGRGSVVGHRAARGSIDKIRSLVGHAGAVRAIVFTGKDSFATAGVGGQIRSKPPACLYPAPACAMPGLVVSKPGP